MKPFISVIIPVYNEEKRLMGLPSIFDYLKRKNIPFEIIIVNDGSKDNTLKIIRKTLEKRPFGIKLKLVSYKTNQGKGFAIKEGILKAQGKHRLFMDVDLSTPIEEFDKFLPYIGSFDVLIGSRKKKGAKLITRQPKLREKLGQGFTKLSQLMLGLKLTDFTCGFKCFSKDAAEIIFQRQKINRWGFDSEILFIAKKKRLSIKEIPVTWRNDSETKVKLPGDIITSLSDLIRIRYNDFRKIYQ